MIKKNRIVLFSRKPSGMIIIAYSSSRRNR
jgi:hypothetical protein